MKTLLAGFLVLLLLGIGLGIRQQRAHEAAQAELFEHIRQLTASLAAIEAQIQQPPSVHMHTQQPTYPVLSVHRYNWDTPCDCSVQQPIEHAQPK